jgi:UDP-N-acetylglucosamine 2-epimerase
MPEEINRIVTDHLCNLLFCPTETAIHNLEREGLADRSVLTGDVMYDAALLFRTAAEESGSPVVSRWAGEQFALATLHRAGNTDDPARLGDIMNVLNRVAREVCPVVMPLHPRTEKRLQALHCIPREVHIIRPVSYLEMLMLESRARFILTDSGGVQKEAYFAQVPCITLREETEWTETLTNNCNTLVGCAEERAMKAIEGLNNAGPWLHPYGRGDAADHILSALRGRRVTSMVCQGLL